MRACTCAICVYGRTYDIHITTSAVQLPSYIDFTHQELTSCVKMNYLTLAAIIHTLRMRSSPQDDSRGLTLNHDATTLALIMASSP
jgi:hypothetical protein